MKEIRHMYVANVVNEKSSASSVVVLERTLNRNYYFSLLQFI